MFHDGINQYQMVTFRLEREVLVLQRTAVQTDEAALLAEYGSELVHDATVDTAVIVLRGLAYLCQLELVDLVFAEQIVQCIGIRTFQCSGRRHSRTQGYVTGKSRIESLYFHTPLNHFAAYAEDVSCPACAGSIFLVQTELDVVFQVDGVSFHCVGAVGLYFCNHAFVDCSGEYKTTVVVSMFTDEVDATRRGINCSRCSVKMLDETASYVFYIHDIIFYKVNKSNYL